MKINRKKSVKIRFEALLIGECFVYDNNLCIKIRDFKVGLTGYEQIDAFCFDTNSAVVVFNDTLVEPKTMELNEV